MATFEYLRVSLLEPVQGNLLSSEGQPFTPITRRAYLERAFESGRVDFEHSGSSYSYLKAAQVGEILVGRIGKQVIEPIHSGPDESFSIQFSEEWKTAWVLFDLSSTSQLAIVQNSIASPKAILSSLFDRIQTLRSVSEYDIFIEYVSEKTDFWAAATEYAGRLTRMEFSFVPPNALGLHEKIRAIVDAAKSQGSEATKFVHTNPDGGITPGGEYVEAALDVTAEGAGSVVLKSGAKVVFSSSKNKKTKNIPNEDVPKSASKSEIASLIEKIRG